MKIKDVIEFDKKGKPVFPTMTACAVCGGYTGFYTSKLGQVNDKALAVQIKLVSHGYWLRQIEGQNYVGKEDFPMPCTCDCNHVWDTVAIGRCLHKWTCKHCGKQITVDSSD